MVRSSATKQQEKGRPHKKRRAKKTMTTKKAGRTQIENKIYKAAKAATIKEGLILCGLLVVENGRRSKPDKRFTHPERSRLLRKVAKKRGRDLTKHSQVRLWLEKHCALIKQAHRSQLQQQRTRLRAAVRADPSLITRPLGAPLPVKRSDQTSAEFKEERSRYREQHKNFPFSSSFGRRNPDRYVVVDELIRLTICRDKPQALLSSFATPQAEALLLHDLLNLIVLGQKIETKANGSEHSWVHYDKEQRKIFEKLVLRVEKDRARSGAEAAEEAMRAQRLGEEEEEDSEEEMDEEDIKKLHAVSDSDKDECSEQEEESEEEESEEEESEQED